MLASAVKEDLQRIVCKGRNSRHVDSRWWEAAFLDLVEGGRGEELYKTEEVPRSL